MASDYGLNFGFRRSDESVRVSEGRLKTPKTGSVLLVGTLVTIDTANPGYLKVATANAPIVPGVTGLLIQEEVWDRGLYEPQSIDSFSLGFCKPNRLSVISTGAGTKFWLKNTTGSTRADGRVIPTVQMFDPTSVAVGRGLAWNGTRYVDVAAGDATQVATVTFYDSTKGLVEAVLTR